MMGYILGVDGGGTKTIVRKTDINGKIIVENESGSSNFKSVGWKRATRNLIDSLYK
jgi:N-acetylglucosamine kinase-like BadF-type ATPase